MLLRKKVVSFDEQMVPRFDLSIIDDYKAISGIAFYLFSKVLKNSNNNFDIALGFECDNSCIPRKAGKAICPRFSVVREEDSILNVVNKLIKEDGAKVLLVKGWVSDFDIASFRVPLSQCDKISDIEVAAIVDARFFPESGNNQIKVHSLVREEEIFLQK